MPQCRAAGGRQREGAWLKRVADAGPSARRSCPTPRTESAPGHEDRHLQRQRHHRPAAAPARMARRVAARRRLPAGAEDLRRDLPRRRASRRAGYSAIWHGQKGFNGVAILARGRRPGRAPARPARRPRRHPQPLHRGRGARRDRRLDLPAQRQPAARAEVRLQAGLVRAPRPRTPRAWSRAASRSSSPATTTSSPTDEVGDIYSPRSWLNDALLQPETREAYRGLLAQGWTDAIQHLHPGEPIYTFWDYFRNRFARDAGLAHRPPAAQRSPRAARLSAAGVDSTCAAARSRATTRRPGSC